MGRGDGGLCPVIAVLTGDTVIISVVTATDEWRITFDRQET
jgi:hypothetical protein